MKGRRVPPPLPALADLIAEGAARDEIEALAVRWAMRQHGGDDWLAISTDPPETVKGGRTTWVVQLDRHAWPSGSDLFLVEVYKVRSGYEVRRYTGPVWTFTPPKGGAA
jgi:hypothetical protein